MCACVLVCEKQVWIHLLSKASLLFGEFDGCKKPKRVLLSSDRALTGTFYRSNTAHMYDMRHAPIETSLPGSVYSGTAMKKTIE